MKIEACRVFASAGPLRSLRVRLRRRLLCGMASAGREAAVLALCLLPCVTQQAAAAPQMTPIRNGGSRLCEVLGTCDAAGGQSGGGGGGSGGGATCGAAPTGPTSCSTAGPAAIAAPTGTSTGAANPVNVSSGNKYQHEVDLPALPGELGIEVVRHYNSASREQGWIGRNWRLSYDTRLAILGTTVQIVQADGRRLMFDREPDNPSLCVSRNPRQGRVHLDEAGSSVRYRWVWPNGRIVHFDEAGRVSAIEAASGERLMIWRGPRGEPLKVRDPQGRELEFIYDRDAAGGWGGIRAIKSPLGTLTYDHGVDGAVAGNLLGIEQPGGLSGRRYHYAAQPGEATASGNTDASVPGNDTDLRNAGGHLLSGISRWSIDDAGQRQTQRLSRYRYDSRGRAIESQRLDPRGEVVEGVGIEYVRSGLFDRATRERSSAAASPGLTIVTDHRGRRTEFWHGVAGDQHALYAVRGNGCPGCPSPGVEYAYTPSGQLAGQLEQRLGQPGVLTRFEHGAEGRVVVVWQQDIAARKGYGERLRPQGKPRWLVRYDYEGPGHQPRRIAQPSIVEGQEHSVEVAYNERGQPTRSTERGWRPAMDGAPAQSIERSSRYEYRLIQGVSRLVAVDGPLVGPIDTVRLEYDSQGRLVRVQHPVDGIQERYNYDHAGRVTTHVPPDAVLVVTEFGTQSRPVRWRRGDVQVTVQWDALGRPLQWQRNDGHSLRLEYDDLGAVKAVVDGEGNRREYQRDAEGRVLQLLWTDASGRAPFDPQRLRYDDAGRLVETSAGAQLRYDNLGRLVSTTDALQRQVRHTYDSLNRLIGIEQSAGTEAHRPFLRTAWDDAATSQDHARILTRLLYHGDERSPSGVVAANGAQTTRAVDDFGRLVKVTSPDTGTTVAFYDEADRMTEAVDAQERRTTFSHDAIGREVARLTRSGAGQDIESIAFRYAGPRLVGVANRQQADGYEWDRQGRLVKQVTRIRRLAGARVEPEFHEFVTRYVYDGVGRLKEKHLPDGLVLLPVYGPHGRPQQLLLRTPDGRIRPIVKQLAIDGVRGLQAIRNRVKIKYPIFNRCVMNEECRMKAVFD